MVIQTLSVLDIARRGRVAAAKKNRQAPEAPNIEQQKPILYRCWTCFQFGEASSRNTKRSKLKKQNRVYALASGCSLPFLSAPDQCKWNNNCKDCQVESEVKWANILQHYWRKCERTTDINPTTWNVASFAIQQKFERPRLSDCKFFEMKEEKSTKVDALMYWIVRVQFIWR